MNSVSLLPRKLVRTAHLLLAAFVLFSLIPRATHAQQEEQPWRKKLVIRNQEEFVRSRRRKFR